MQKFPFEDQETSFIFYPTKGLAKRTERATTNP